MRALLARWSRPRPAGFRGVALCVAPYAAVDVELAAAGALGLLIPAGGIAFVTRPMVTYLERAAPAPLPLSRP
jgi:hypothetical protein